MENPSGYDVIGDIHGYAEELEGLLGALGYTETHGAYRHPERMAVFLGDLIDRGPDQLRTVKIVRNMVDAGTALAVMGNHEFNAIGWMTPLDGDHARTHSERNRSQHRAFLAAVGEDSAQHHEHVDWFRTLPLWLDLEGLRIVHACWDPSNMATLGDGRLTDQIVESPRGSDLFVAAEVVLKGPEIDLRGNSFLDWEQHERFEARYRWWDPTVSTLADAVEVPPETSASWPDADIPIDRSTLPSSPVDVPVIFGHYWRSGHPTIYGPRAACLDWSVANKGPLVAYRWSGEKDLTNNNLQWVGKP